MDSPNTVAPLLAETAGCDSRFSGSNGSFRGDLGLAGTDGCVSRFSGSKGSFRGDVGLPKVFFSGEGDLVGSGSFLGDCGPDSSKNLDILFISSFRGDGG